MGPPEFFSPVYSYEDMVNLIYPPSYMSVYAKCIDATLPNFEPEEWIIEGRVYTVKHFTEPLNQEEGMAVTIIDEEGEEIHPSPSHWSFSSNRFELFSVFLN